MIERNLNGFENEADCKSDKPLPQLYDSAENCCGCAACYALCPVRAISMEPDEEGFLYPAIDASKCIRCYLCISVCVFKRDQKEKGFYTPRESGKD